MTGNRLTGGLGRVQLLAPLLLVGATLLVYAGSLDGPFVMDDVSSIVKNPNVRTLWPLREAISAPNTAPVAGRPTTSFSLALNHAIGGMAPRSFRIGNLIIHIAAGLALFGVIRRTFQSPTLAPRFADAASGIAFASALLWLLHPLNSELIGYLTQRSDALFGLLLFCTLYCALRSAASASSTLSWQAAAVIACALGMGSKEIMVTAPVIVLLHDQVFTSGSFSSALGRRPALYAGLFASWGVLALALVGGPDYSTMRMGFGAGATPQAYLLSQGGVILHYLRLVLWPHPLLLDYGDFAPVPLGQALLPCVLVGGLVLGSFGLYGSGLKRAHRERQALAFAGLWFFIILAPTSSVVPIVGEVATERRLYASLAAPVVLAVVAGSRLLRGRGQRTLAVVLVAILLGAATALRMRDYRTSLALWTTVVERAPNNPRGFLHVGNALRDLGRTEEAMAYYRESNRLDPKYIEPLNNLAAVLFQGGDFERASELFEAAIRYEPRVAHLHFNLARVQVAQGRFRDALANHRIELDLQPVFQPSMHEAAWILATHPDPELRDAQEAVRLARRAARITRGRDIAGLDVLAAAYARAGRFDEALDAIEGALALAEQRGAGAQGALRERRTLYRAGQPYTATDTEDWKRPGS